MEGNDSPDVTNDMSLTYNWTSSSSRKGKKTFSWVRINNPRMLDHDTISIIRDILLREW